MKSADPPQAIAPAVRWLLVLMGSLCFIGCEKADYFRIRGNASAALTNDDLVSLQQIAGAACLRDGRVWGVYATHATKFDNQPVIRACVITKFTHRDDAIAFAECVVCYKAAPGYLSPALHRHGAWGSFEKDAERCAFVSPTRKALNFDDLPTNPVLVRGDLQRWDVIEIIRSHPGLTGALNPSIESGSSPDEVMINRTSRLRRHDDGTWAFPALKPPLPIPIPTPYVLPPRYQTDGPSGRR